MTQDVVVIRITRPGNAKRSTKALRAQITTNESAYEEELDVSWALIAKVADDVKRGKRNLGGEIPQR